MSVNTYNAGSYGHPLFLAQLLTDDAVPTYETSVPEYPVRVKIQDVPLFAEITSDDVIYVMAKPVNGVLSIKVEVMI